MKPYITCFLVVLTSCYLPKEDQLESCIREKVEKNGAKVTYFLQTKQRYINKGLLLKKLKVTVLLPSGKKEDRKDSLLFRMLPDGTWECESAVGADAANQ